MWLIPRKRPLIAERSSALYKNFFMLGTIILVPLMILKRHNYFFLLIHNELLDQNNRRVV
jgi:hypothetical protein